MSMFVLELTMLDSEAKEKMEQTLYRKSSSRSLPGSIIRSRNGASSLGPNREKLQNGHGVDYGQTQHAGNDPGCLKSRIFDLKKIEC